MKGGGKHTQNPILSHWFISSSFLEFLKVHSENLEEAFWLLALSQMPGNCFGSFQNSVKYIQSELYFQQLKASGARTSGRCSLQSGTTSAEKHKFRSLDKT